jgi:hypothetical protein
VLSARIIFADTYFSELSMKMKVGLSAVGIALGIMCGAAQATPLGINQTVTPNTLATAPGGVLMNSVSTNISTPTFSGTLRSAVYDGPETGTNLDFYYQFSNNTGSRNAIGRVTAFDFGTFATDVSQTAQAFGIFLAGDTAAGSADRDALGTIGFNMLPTGTAGKLSPGNDSNTFLVRTRATQFASGFSGVIDGTATFAPAFQPVIPEPGTNALIAAGLGLMAFVVRRRSKRHNLGA